MDLFISMFSVISAVAHTHLLILTSGSTYLLNFLLLTITLTITAERITPCPISQLSNRCCTWLYQAGDTPSKSVDSNLPEEVINTLLYSKFIRPSYHSNPIPCCYSAFLFYPLMPTMFNCCGHFDIGIS
ncbi:hypothetical protein QCA50_011119 [Cerrena zonata]|uniref:Uncharacterized protein n=1 Tax=Cerrena zonata TaxID=2478898 RepID=A0AAW0G700_9APHY